MCQLVSVRADSVNIEGDDDNSIYFILMGRISIRINGREVAIRSAGWHVGELVLPQLFRAETPRDARQARQKGATGGKVGDRQLDSPGRCRFILEGVE